VLAVGSIADIAEAFARIWVSRAAGPDGRLDRLFAEGGAKHAVLIPARIAPCNAQARGLRIGVATNDSVAG
jgi:hypothetical protein